MTLTYLDQVAIIKLGFAAKRQDFRLKLDAAIACGSLTFAVSPWHLIETAHTTNLEGAVALAEFVDSLKPMWLLERLDIMRLDVEEDLYRFAKIDFEPIPRVTTRSAAISSLNRGKDSPRYDIPSRTFVKQWIQHPDQLATLEGAYAKNTEALTGIREHVAAGRMTPEIKRQAEREYLHRVLPTSTRSGLETGRELRNDYVEQADVGRIPSLAIESAISEHQWNAQGGADRNTQIDKMHLAALPYADEIVSSDKFFHQLYPITTTTGHVRARLVSCDTFLSRL